MSLQSNLFRGDAKLEAAAVSDPAHITTGASGNHVAKIQQALIQLGCAKISPIELQTSRYGLSTAAAVLRYKQKRDIVNRSYQTSADDIVGKMTMASLDREILAKESRHTLCAGCGDPDQGGERVTARSLSTLTRAAEPSATTKFPANLDLLLHYTRSALARADSRNWRYIERATELLRPFGIQFVSSVSGTGGVFAGGVVPYDSLVDPRFREDGFRVRQLAEQILPGRPGALRVIACPFSSNSQEFGLTDGGQLDTQTFPDFILLNAARLRQDQGTLLHEMIHATGLRVHDKDEPSIFSEGSSRNVLKPVHAERLSKAFFAH